MVTMAIGQDSSNTIAFARYRPFRMPAVANSLAELVGQLKGLEHVVIDGFVAQLEASGGGLWLLWQPQNGKAVAFAAVDALPGLPDLYELSGGVAPAWRGKGLGRQLGDQLRVELPALGITHLEALVPDEGGKQFLRALGFTAGHEELMLRRPLHEASAPVAPAQSLFLITFERAWAISTFRHLHERSFAGLRWHQPYASDAAVEEWLDEAADILFLTEWKRPIGFVWLQQIADPSVVQLEPVGILPEYQGRGWGRYLLESALLEAHKRGFKEAEIGVWRDNAIALKLYTGLGFRPVSQRQFLVLAL